MKISHMSLIAVMIVVIGVAVAGCSSSTPAAPAPGEAPTAGSTGGSAPAATTAAGSSSGSAVTGANIFGGAANWNWVEYKMTTEGMTIFMKYDKNGKCTMRYEGANIPPGMAGSIDCSSKGGSSSQTATNPTDFKSDVQFKDLGPSPITVGAGTFAGAKKYSSTIDGNTVFYWVEQGKPLLKMEPQAGMGGMELNSWG